MTSLSLEAIRGRFGEDIRASEFRGQLRWDVPAARLLDLLTALAKEGGFDFLTDITCVDYLHYRDAEHRFGVIYLLTNLDKNLGLTVRTHLDEPEPTLPSVVFLWEGANWMEREVWDMFGIKFDGHPDLRRILMPEPFTAHPLRKDYPLQGRGERHNFTTIRRADA